MSGKKGSAGKGKGKDKDKGKDKGDGGGVIKVTKGKDKGKGKSQHKGVKMQGVWQGGLLGTSTSGPVQGTGVRAEDGAGAVNSSAAS